jgi:hypothetical protein
VGPLVVWLDDDELCVVRVVLLRVVDFVELPLPEVVVAFVVVISEELVVKGLHLLLGLSLGKSQRLDSSFHRVPSAQVKSYFE